MPIYEYTCSLCGAHLEKLQKANDPAPVDCPKCGKPGLEKQVSAASFSLKGSGWYASDYKKPTPSETKENKESTETKDKGGCDSGGCGHGDH